MRWTNLVTLMDAEAARQEQANDHPAAILLREGAEAIREASRQPAPGEIVIRKEADQPRMTTIPMPGVSIPFPIPPVIGSPINRTASAILGGGTPGNLDHDQRRVG